MNSSSERLVFFVTPAQKRVLAARAARMGISLSELVRRAVLAFDDTGQEVRAAGLVDRLAAASEASRNDTLRRLAQGQPREAASNAAAAGASDESREAASTERDAPPTPVSLEVTASAPDDHGAKLPVAAAVARALVAQAEAEAEAAARPGEQSDAEMEALVARVIGSAERGEV